MPNVISFLILTIVLGGAAAFMTGRALAGGWKAPVGILLYAVLLAGAVRFLHAALANEPTGIANAASAYLLMAAFAGAGFALRRRAQMARQYPWLSKV